MFIFFFKKEENLIKEKLKRPRGTEGLHLYNLPELILLKERRKKTPERIKKSEPIVWSRLAPAAVPGNKSKNEPLRSTFSVWKETPLTWRTCSVKKQYAGWQIWINLIIPVAAKQ